MEKKNRIQKKKKNTTKESKYFSNLMIEDFFSTPKYTNLDEGTNNRIKPMFSTQKLETINITNLSQNENKVSQSPNSPFKLNPSQLISYENEFQEQRKEIYLALTLEEKINLTYNLITLNRANLITYISHQRLTNPATDSNAFHYYIDYFYNYILLFLLLYKNRSYNDAYTTINHLLKEMKYGFTIDKYIKEKVNSFNDKYNDDIIEYIKFISCLVQCTYRLNKNHLYETILLSYIEVIESIQDNKLFLSYLYFYTANILVELDYLKCAFITYDFSLKSLNEYARLLRAQKMQVSIIYNKGLLSYVIGDDEKIPKAISLITEAKRLKLKLLEEQHIKSQKGSNKSNNSSLESKLDKIRNSQLLKIYLTLFELDYNNSNSDIVSEYIKYITENTESLNEKDINRLNFIFEKMDKTLTTPKNINLLSSPTKLENDNNKIQLTPKINSPFQTGSKNNVSIIGQYNSQQEEQFIDFVLSKNKKQNIPNEIDKIEFEKFFLFMTKLSAYQIELLNIQQPSMKSYKKFSSLPIYFSNTFKQSLSLEQLSLLNNIKVLTLKRKSVLKKVTNPITLENLDLSHIYQQDTNFNSLFHLKNIKNVNKKLSQFEAVRSQNALRESIQMINPIKEFDNLIRSDSIPEFIFQNKIPYDSIKANLKKYLKSNPHPKYKFEEIYRDSIVVELLNKMKFKEIKILNNNPDWLIEILVEFKEKMEVDVNSIITKPEIKQQEIIEDVIKEKDEESISDKGENEKKSIELIDVLNVRKND